MRIHGKRIGRIIGAIDDLTAQAETYLNGQNVIYTGEQGRPLYDLLEALLGQLNAAHIAAQAVADHLNKPVKANLG